MGRYDDIWAGYVVLAIADHMDQATMFGFPLVKQERNPHNYFKDHMVERVGLEHTETFCEWLRAFTFTVRRPSLQCAARGCGQLCRACGSCFRNILQYVAVVVFQAWSWRHAARKSMR